MLRFDVEDADTEANGPPYKFDIVEGQPDHEFKVDGDGVLTTAARFNRDIKDQYDLVIRVYDNGNPSLFTDTTVRVLLCRSESDRFIENQIYGSGSVATKIKEKIRLRVYFRSV